MTFANVRANEAQTFFPGVARADVCGPLYKGAAKRKRRPFAPLRANEAQT